MKRLAPHRAKVEGGTRGMKGGKNAKKSGQDMQLGRNAKRINKQIDGISTTHAHTRDYVIFGFATETHTEADPTLARIALVSVHLPRKGGVAWISFESMHLSIQVLSHSYLSISLL